MQIQLDQIEQELRIGVKGPILLTSSLSSQLRHFF